MSIDANAGDRIKISPATSGVATLPSYISIFYQITETLTPVDPSETFSYSGTLSAVTDSSPTPSNSIVYKIDDPDVILSTSNPLWALNSGQDINFRYAGSGGADGIVFKPNDTDPDGSSGDYLQAYSEQTWQLTVTDSNGTVFEYYWNTESLVLFTQGFVRLPAGNLTVSSDEWPDATNDHIWGTDPTFVLAVSGTTPPPPPADDDSWTAFFDLMNSSSGTGVPVDLGGRSFTIQNSNELEEWGGNELATSFAGTGTLTNGAFTGSINPKQLTWTEVTSGAYVASLPTDVTDLSSDYYDPYDVFNQIGDEDQTQFPLYKTRGATGQPPPTSMNRYRWVYNDDWITFTVEDIPSAPDFNQAQPIVKNCYVRITTTDGQVLTSDDWDLIKRRYNDDTDSSVSETYWLQNPEDALRIRPEVETKVMTEDVATSLNTAAAAAGLGFTFEAGDEYEWQTDVVEEIFINNNTKGQAMLAQFNVATDNAFPNGSNSATTTDFEDVQCGIGSLPAVMRFTHFTAWDGTVVPPVTDGTPGEVARFAAMDSTLQYSNYFYFGFGGCKKSDSNADALASIDQGEYFIRASNGSLYYKPVDTNVIDAYIADPNAAVPKVFRPIMGKGLQLNPGADLTFDNVDIKYWSENGNNRVAIFGSTNDDPDNNPYAILRLNNMNTMGTHAVCSKVSVVARDSVFEETRNRFMDILGGDIQDCYFGNSYTKSQMTLTNDRGAQYIIKDNFFTLPATMHGQICAAYFGSWQNVEITHNIFYNCGKNILSYQPLTNTKGDPNNNGTYKVSNNLIYTDYIAMLPIPAGQSGFAFNGASDVDTAGAPGAIGDQKVIITNNTSWMDTDYEFAEQQNQENVVQSQQWTMTPHFASDVLFVNNIARAIRHSYDPTNSRWIGAQTELRNITGDSAAVPLKHVSMYNTLHGMNQNDNSLAGYGQHDFAPLPAKSYPNPIPGNVVANPAGVFDEATLETEGAWSTGASDGGELGVRWNSIPNVSQLATLSTNYGRMTPGGASWADTYTAAPVPDVLALTPQADDRVQATDDYRP
jgi:hypothetical protein